MDSRLQIDDRPTDMMRRRTPLALRGRFHWFGTTVTIRTDSPAVLNAAEEAGLELPGNSEEEPGMRWEIASVQPGATAAENWECKATLDAHSLYLSMGPEQWFAFDLETGDGAGFVVSDPGRLNDPNAELYLLAIAYNVGACLRLEMEKSCRHV
jgi:hypothetical protein